MEKSGEIGNSGGMTSGSGTPDAARTVSETEGAYTGRPGDVLLEINHLKKAFQDLSLIHI